MAGKIFSDKNEKSIKEIHSLLTKMLLESGVPVEDLLVAVNNNKNIVAAQASGFAGRFNESIWIDNLHSALQLLENTFIHHSHNSAQSKEMLVSTLSEFKAVVGELIVQMPKFEDDRLYPIYCSAQANSISLLQAEVSSFKESWNHRVWIEGLKIACRMFCHSLEEMMFGNSFPHEDKVQHLQVSLSALVEVFSEAIDTRITATEDSPKIQAESLQAIELTPQSVSNLSVETANRVPIEIKCAARVGDLLALEANAEKIDLNRQPFAGVLFPVDTLSDGTPAAGPGRKLYVPRDVAQTAVDLINASGGMPLDIRDDMSGHNDSNITGIMTSAAIVGNDCVVYGHLFPYNKPEEAEAIAKYVNSLGMSINAEASSHEVSMVNPVTGQTEIVAWVDELYPLGANILFSSLATWQTTKVLQAQGSASRTGDSYGSISVRASRGGSETLSHDPASMQSENTNQSAGTSSLNTVGTSSTIPSTKKMNPENQNQASNAALENIQSMISGFIQASKQESQDLKESVKEGFSKFENRIQQLEQSNQDTEEVIVALKAEKQQTERQLQEEKAQKEAKTNAEKMAQMVQAAVRAAINPNAHPASLTAPMESLVAEAQPVANAVGTNERQLIAAQAKLDTLSEAGITGSERIKASDEVNRLKAVVRQEKQTFGSQFASM